jgi:hypothetical protein
MNTESKERFIHAFETRYSPQLAGLYGQMSQEIIAASQATDLFLAFGRSGWLLVGDLLKQTPECRDALAGKTVRIVPKLRRAYGDLAYLADLFRTNVPEVMQVGSVTLLDDTADSFAKIQNIKVFFKVLVPDLRLLC